MKICLISPPTATEFNERQMSEFEAMSLLAEYAPMGILSLAAVLESQGVSATIIDLNFQYYDYIRSGAGRREGASFCSYVDEQLKPLSFDVFGFSTICSTYPLTLRLAAALRRTHPEAAIILGGPQASVVAEATLRAFPHVDYVLRGEAEETFPILLDAIAHGASGLPRVGGLTYRRGTEVLRNPNAPVIADLDVLPMPAYHLYPYTADISYAPLEAGRGCPFSCSFCSTNDFFRRRFRMKSPQVLVGQMLAIKQRYGVKTFDLIHDMFTVDRRKVLAFCDAVVASDEKFSWGCSARTDCLDEELISRMARAGCYGVFLGIDSGSERIQKIMDKGLDIPESLTRVRQAARHRFSTTVSLIAGFPEETREDLRATVRFAGESLRYKGTELQLHLLAPLAETPITTRYREQLVYDEIFSDISFQGWEQDLEDRAMIMAHRDIFPNFYSVPTPWLDRHYLKELREFLLKGAVRHRVLMLLLHQDSGDLLQVFDEWQRWSSPDEAATRPEARNRDYYLSRAFSDDLLGFARSHYAEGAARHPHLVKTVADVESALFAMSEDLPAQRRRHARRKEDGPESLRLDAVPVSAGGLRVLHVDADYKKIVRRLSRSQSLDPIPAASAVVALLRSGEKVRILQLDEITSRLFSMCDGTRNVGEIAVGFFPAERIQGMPAVKVGLYGLMSFARQGLIEFKKAAA